MLKLTIKDVFFNYHNEIEKNSINLKALEFLQDYPAFKDYVNEIELTEDSFKRI